ncbi:hemolysin family protein [Trichlorobacter lovleyi]|uniref:CBS domain containing protein n=1 Tax=Trichlorobacter lovleyi (strain ATCC BAA-1151 / DSM 17278 / SZ) TaxID=398767 RepID=B3E7C9_TRIL1|nr:hemolysin family protein [Trichlorobacter lovleyi]ACD96446.1 CBS domain containing protein [Trichlorobacter lovleyi SZ]
MDEGSSRRPASLLDRVARLVIGRKKVTEEEIHDLIEAGEEEGIVDEQEREMISAILELDSTVVREIMVPRTEMAAISVEASVRETIDAIIACGHSRMPVYDGTMDNIIGLLYAKDLLKSWGMADSQIQLRDLIRQPFFTPETKTLELLLQEFKKKKVHLAIVVDEYGGTSGLVTIEDLLEQIVGDIQDEYDMEEDLYVRNPDGSLTTDARLPIEELEEQFQLEIERDKFDTVGGLVVHLADGIPVAGTVVIGEDLEIEILEADPRKVKRVKISRLPKATELPTS